jgi:hypothetical protein
MLFRAVRALSFKRDRPARLTSSTKAGQPPARKNRSSVPWSLTMATTLTAARPAAHALLQPPPAAGLTRTGRRLYRILRLAIEWLGARGGRHSYAGRSGAP